ncbi:MAG: response regulator [Alphaproteobacteria bacterium]
MADILKQLLAAFEVEHREHLDAIREQLAAARNGMRLDVRQAFRRVHSLKGAARAVGLTDVEDASHALETFFERFLTGDGRPSTRDLAKVERELDAIEGLVAAQRQEMPAAEIGTELAEYLRVDAAQMARLSSSMHALSGDLGAVEGLAEALQDIHRQARALTRRLEEAGRMSARLAPALAERLSALEPDSRALLRALGAASRQQAAAAWGIAQAAGRVREEIERIALVPAADVFSGLGRMVRDLAEEMERDVDVEVDGLTVEADRGLLQGLRDPVIHLFRNALAHGIEPAAVRTRKGKPPRGAIGLRIVLRGGMLCLSVYDDGAGPDLDRIAETARRRGLLSPALRAAPAPDQLLALVFEPGFSTADGIDVIAGRGVGLSVVAEAAKAAGGSARMLRRFPAGTTVEIAVPLSVARQPILLAVAGEALYGMPTRGVDRILRIALESLEVVDGRPVCRIDAEGNSIPVPVVVLSTVLGRPAPMPAEAGMVNLILLRDGERRLGVAVDRVDDVRTTTLSEVGIGGQVSDLVLGAAQVEGGEVAIVLGPEAVLNRYERGEVVDAAGSESVAMNASRAIPTILVVDDSITTRTLEKSILEAQGYRVLLSVDGLDALTRLRSGAAPVDLIVADVEMPRMDGFQLLQALKSDAHLSTVPVVLMTSRADPDDVRRGLELGADAYLVKQRFDQRELLSTIGQLL